MVLCNILPAALYGVEAATVSATPLDRLRSIITKVVGPGSAKRNVDLTFELTKCSRDLDPGAHIMYLRAAGLRRIIAKRGDHILSLITYSITQYHTMCVHGRPPDRGSGLVGLLFCQLYDSGYSLLPDLRAHADLEPVLDLWNIPWQMLRRAVFDLHARFWVKRVDANRTFHAHIGELDSGILKGVVNDLGRHEGFVFRHVATGAFWADHQLAAIGVKDPLCPHCSVRVDTADHVTWYCPVVNAHRKVDSLSHINPDHLPPCIKQGLPPSLSADSTEPFWGLSLFPAAELSALEEQAFGIPQLDDGLCNAQRANCILHAELTARGVAMEEVNARQAVMLIKQSLEPPHMPLPHTC